MSVRPTAASTPAGGRGAEAPLPAVLAVTGVVIWCLVSALSALIEILLIPVYVGRYIFPITVPIAIGLNLVLPRMTSIVARRPGAAWLPMVCWLIVVIPLSFSGGGGSSVLVPGAGEDQYVGLALLFIGILAGFVGVIRVMPSGPQRPPPAPPIRSGSSARR